MLRPLAILGSLGIVAALAPGALAAELAAIFADHMVLQRDQPLRVWGSGAVGERIEVAFAGQRSTCEADGNGAWAVTVGPTAAGGPFELTIAAKSGDVKLEDVLVGEVWLASGQSNMDWPVKQSLDAPSEMAGADRQTIRLFKGERVYADAPSSAVRGVWEACTPESVGDFSAVAYTFARELSERLGVPVGVMQVAWGGSALEAWMSEESLAASAEGRQRLEDLPHLRENYDRVLADFRRQEAELARLAEQAKTTGAPAPARLVPGYGVRQKEWPCGLFNGMIHPLVGFPIRGVIWYQGEANTARPREYSVLFPAMITDWRTRWGQGDFPFLFVQIANYRDRGSQPRDHDWARLREAQTRALELPNTGMAVAIDVGEADNIHPANKREVGRRLSLLAADVVYGQPLQSQSPRMGALRIDGNRAIVSFTHTYGSLTARGEAVRGFALAGPDGRFEWADAVIQGEDVVLSSPAVPQPVAVRYGWDGNPDVNLYNAAGLPAVPFRTDDW